MHEERPTVTVFLVDDHEVVRRGVADVLSGAPDLLVVGEAGSVAEALRLGPELRPDVAVVDLRLPDGDGVQVARELRAAVPGLAVLLLTSYSDDEALLEAVRAGAAGYLLKQVIGQDLVAAVRAAGAGRSLMDPRAVAAARERLAERPRAGDVLAVLTDQERVVVELIGEGLTNRQIGQRMFLAEKTVKNHVSHLLAKLGLERRTQVAVLATRLRPPGGS
ncbi:response regulator transcription factor [Klenkia sp. PcliD-1-E]|uniref:response regulator n=1 Tax=Klenkia sp. PcliD-1-E TaxID=2954492 RepID=UPI00209748A2|nr:response regulator transcription factor [Klenkia sp. PcliD-1-E]MCO7222020.1 response regulator transcription factor [Klenkia sp. PcliD-1-E]